MTALRETIEKWSGLVVVLAAVLGITFTFARPAAEEFIKGRVDAVVNDRITSVEKGLDDLRKAQRSLEIEAAKTNAGLETLRQGQAEQRQDLKEVGKDIRELITRTPKQ